MTYIPTAEDVAFLTEAQPNKFANPDHVRWAIGSSDGAMQDELAAHYYDEFVSSGGEPLTESPLPPPEADPDGDGILDPQFAAACPECESAKPCCMTGGSVEDSTDGSRKLTWPPENNQTTLLTVAKDVQGTDLISKVKVKWEGEQCKVGHLERPAIDAKNFSDFSQRFTEQDLEWTIGYPQPPSFLLMMAQYLDGNDGVIYCVFMVDAFLAFKADEHRRSGATFSPFQCLSDPATAATLKVIPLPYMKLDGDFELATQISITTAGVRGTAEIKWNITGNYGAIEIKQKGNPSASSGTTERNDGGEAPGLIGTMASLVGTIERYVGEGGGPAKPVDVTDFVSGVTMSKSLKFSPTGFELEAKGGSPDLELKIGSLKSELMIGVTGRIDFIDVLARIYTGPGASKIAEARARMAAGKSFSAKLDAYLEAGATGTLTHEIDSGVTVLIPASGEMAASGLDVQQTFGGEIKITGKAKIGIEVEANVWVFQGKAGANGSVHTSWTWEMRMNAGQREKRYEFEGVILSFEAYAEASIRRKEAGVTVAQDLFIGRIEGDSQAADLFETVDDAISGSNRAARALEAERAGAADQTGELYTIFRPEKTQWEAY